MIEKIRAAIVGYGNIGKAVLDALAASPDFELAGVVRRDPSVENLPKELYDAMITDDITHLGRVDVAILCCPSRLVPATAEKYLKMGIHTVDSFDVHGDIWDVKCRLEQAAKTGNAVSILSAGWDPGSDSIVRCLLEAIAPKGVTYTNFGPGMSMGHTVAVKAIPGVKKALSVTIPKGTGVHRRMVYIELMDGYEFDTVANAIKSDSYFAHDETIITLVDSVDALIDVGHGVSLVRKGVSGITPNQRFSFDMSINNPALTGQVLVCAARAAMKQRPGCYTMIEIPMIDYVAGEKEALIRRLV